MERLMSWFSVDPAVSLLMVIAAVVLFASALARRRAESDALWPWVRRIIEASIGAVLFLGLLWAFRMLLNSNVASFEATHGSRSDINRESAYSIWGRPHIQEELTVSHSIEVEVQEEIPQKDPSLPPLFRTVKQRQDVPQNSIRAFRGHADMTLSEREKGYAFYSGFVLNAEYIYTIVNDSEFTTDANFLFPLAPGQTIFQDFSVKVNGKETASDLRYGGDVVSWTEKMTPHQRETVAISYITRGMDFFYYHIPMQRAVQDFVFTLTVDRLPTSLLNYPQGVLTPTEINSTPDGRGAVLTWRLNQAITTAGMGVALVQPEQPGEKVLRVLANSPYALTMLGAILALTLLILGLEIHFLDLALLGGIYSVQFLIMAGMSDTFLGFWGSLILGAAATLFLTYLLYRKLPSRPIRWLLLALVAFFTVGYPLSGLLEQNTAMNAFQSLVQVAMIVYLFSLTLIARLRTKENTVGVERR
jgi:hypothetical protein